MEIIIWILLLLANTVLATLNYENNNYNVAIANTFGALLSLIALFFNITKVWL